MKAVMYHFVREGTPDLPFFRFLDASEFARQLDYFEEHFGFVSREAFFGALEGKPVPEGVVLTFDDGFSDHYHYVLPELMKRGLWGIFFIPTGVYETRKLLDVHRVHCLIGRYGGQMMLREMQARMRPGDIRERDVETYQRTTYIGQSNDAATTAFKQTINYFASPARRKEIMDDLAKSFLDEARLVQDFYMTPDMLCSMHDEGMVMGSHTVSHPVMARLPRDQQQLEIEQSFDFLDGILGHDLSRCFCYPYGGADTYTEETQDLLRQAGCRFSFCVEARDTTRDDLSNKPQALPRFDCNAFPHGAARLGCG